MSNFKPMLAATCEDITQLSFPLIASPKLDGIRCLIKDGVALSRSLKPIPNEHVQVWAQTHGEAMQGYDGELLIGAHDGEVFRRTTSGVMSIDGTPDFTYHVFDTYDRPGGWWARSPSWDKSVHRVKIVPSRLVYSVSDVLADQTGWLRDGYEGIILRRPSASYKFGRSTLKEGALLKVKLFSDAEATVVGVEELMHNNNPAKKNELGQTDRSTDAAGLVPAGTLGALVCITPVGVQFKIGTGLDAATRAQLWAERDKLPGRLVKYKYFDVGVKDKPRHPVFLGWRHADDTGEVV